ncbi:glutathione S-transferase [Coralloluteibacterium stylophorae]|uniref:Glutathione S-transferase n=1 Tax=Coralloluteibacterium stylophorae TaxID=1776034 RepID=A0A8J7VQB6_9GAMM|nr:glutathione S-transferase [Coralloluteibacterium stylophorae]MBS7456901.1 glutathione S-transferase [Coralloluteibacterium stylophorae]
MQLIGMLDSPYVRRVAISLRLLGLDFEHRPLSVFRDFDAFRGINPVVKAPTLVCDEGEVLMDSTLILAYAEARARPRSLMPTDVCELRRALRVIGLALAVSEKAVQVVYEHRLRPAEKAHAPWLERVGGQLLAGLSALEDALEHGPLAADGATIDQAGITAAVAWRFAVHEVPDRVVAERFPRLAAYAAAAESLPEFRAFPYPE